MSWRKTTLTIPSGAANSPWLSLIENGARRRVNLKIGTAEATLTGTVTLQVAEDDSGTRTTTHQGPAGTDIAIAAGKSITLLDFTAGAIRLHSSGNEGADRVFSIEGAASYNR